MPVPSQVEVLWQVIEALMTVKPPHLHPFSRIRIWYWNQAGANSFICPVAEAKAHRERLIAEGAVVWHTEIRDA